MVDAFKCRTSHAKFPATSPLSLGQLRQGGRNYYFQCTFESNNVLSESTLASKLPCIYTRTCQWYDTHRSHPEQLTLTSGNQRDMPQAPGDSLLQLTENRETHPNRQHLPERWKLTITFTMKLLRMDTVLLLYEEKIQSQGILNVQDYKQCSTIMSRSGKCWN